MFIWCCVLWKIYDKSSVLLTTAKVRLLMEYIIAIQLPTSWRWLHAHLPAWNSWSICAGIYFRWSLLYSHDLLHSKKQVQHLNWTTSDYWWHLAMTFTARTFRLTSFETSSQHFQRCKDQRNQNCWVWHMWDLKNKTLNTMKI